jgi:hypothetical protein
MRSTIINIIQLVNQNKSLSFDDQVSKASRHFRVDNINSLNSRLFSPVHDMITVHVWLIE